MGSTEVVGVAGGGGDRAWLWCPYLYLASGDLSVCFRSRAVSCFPLPTRPPCCSLTLGPEEWSLPSVD